MRKILLGISLFFLALVITAPGLKAGEKIELRLRLQKGESYNLRNVLEQAVTQTIGGQKVEKVNTLRMEYRFEVEGLDPDGTASVKTTYQSCAMKMTGPDGGSIEYDSASPTAVDNPILKIYAALVGKDFRMRITSMGHVREVTGMQAVMKQVLENLDLPDGPQRDGIESYLKNQFGDQAIKEAMDNMLAVYPDQPVGIGDSWKRRSVISGIYPVIIENTWTLKDHREGRSVIEVNSLIKPDPEAPPMEMGPMKIKPEFSGEMTGTMELDESTGWIKSAKMDQELSGELKMEGNPQQPGGMIIPTSIKTVITIEPF
ncbi:MAG TPA: DUF6263 family protein [archaeon]|nr:DUF6263 family protein [archaeon]